MAEQPLDIWADIGFDTDGLVPALVQDASDGTVLMFAHMNRASLALSLQTGYTHFCHRETQKVWKQGTSTGQMQRVRSMHYDADGKALLIQVELLGASTGQAETRSCFVHAIPVGPFEHAALSDVTPASSPEMHTTAQPPLNQMLDALYELILQRRDAGDDTSYVQGLFQRGQDVICKKVVEEAGEVLLASKNNDPSEIVYEMADLWFHSLVLLGNHNVRPEEVLLELQRRFGQPGGGKETPNEAPSTSKSNASET